MPKDPQEQAEKLYEQMLDLLEQIGHFYANVDGDDAEEPFDDQDVLDMMAEEAAERGLDEESIRRVFAAIAALGRKSREG